ncbi:MDR family MFS transporter [Deinococcus ruber]|uniref:MFS transporter n=1 Tax=Deinococcus ruber TaxID=1848197 RepID=A0A918F9G0_9DEIO|nr:MFS transporter [Deinococcus ruber]GGR13015.1 MFS transporter [Deinococcus ruber]
MYTDYPPAFWVLWVGTLINRLGEFVVPLLGFYLLNQRGLSVGQVSVILGALGVGRFFAEGLGGGIIDRYGPASAMRLSLAGGAVLLALVPQAQGFWFLLLGILGYSLLTALYKPASNTAVAELTTGEQRTRAYNLLYWAINVGASVAPVLGGWLAGRSFRLVFYLDAATMFIYTLLLTRWFPQGIRPSTPHVSRRSLLPRDPLLGAFCVASLLYGLTYQSYKMLALVFAQQGYSAAQYGQTLAVNGLLVVILGLPLGHLTSKTNDSRWQVAGAALLGAGFLIHSFAHTLWVHLLAVVVWSLGEIVAYSISKTIISELGPATNRATYIGLVGSMSGLAALGAPLLGGWLLTQFGAAVMWWVVAALSFVAALVFLRLEQPLAERRAHLTV